MADPLFGSAAVSRVMSYLRLLTISSASAPPRAIILG
jgi:hypothetical protein